jgi:hypothetical protein
MVILRAVTVAAQALPDSPWVWQSGAGSRDSSAYSYVTKLSTKRANSVGG